MLSFCVSFLLWFLWTQLGGVILPVESALSLGAETLAKALIWLGPGLLFMLRRDGKWMILPGRLFAAPFPWLPTVVGLCLTAAFLHTAHIFLSGFGTWGIFRPAYIWMSLAAAVIEELAFRGFLFNRQAAVLRVSWAAVANGLLFALYHFPEFLLGQNLAALIGLRFWVIAVMGCVFSITLVKWRHLGMNMLIHFVWNLLCFWFALA